jgi:Flp pilus assembly protein TadD
MFYLRRFLLVMCLAIMLPQTNAATFDLRLDRLADSFKLLQETDRASVDEVVGLIKMGDHSGALARLQELNQRNPQNSSLRVLTAYTMLQLGNLVGAFDQARQGEATPGKDSYKCWVLAKIALLNGDDAVCKRELKHVRKVGDMPEEAKSLEAEIKKKKS